MSRPASPSSLPSLYHSSPSSSSSSLPLPLDRPNQHLAVLLPKQLWKPDSSASTCDNLYCRVLFSLIERRHHCRKCGGVFCAPCSSRSTPLLDTSNLVILHPPRNVPLTKFESPISPIIDSRVCDDCWDQLHGFPSTPHSPGIAPSAIKRVLSHPISMFNRSSSSLCNSPISLSPAADVTLPPSLTRRSHSLRDTPILSTQSPVTSASASSTPLRATHPTLPTGLERSYGELDTYPLRRSSVLCKATGGGRWEPKQSPVLDGYRQPIPGGKAPYEIRMEHDKMRDRQRRENPVIKDGEFQYRFPKVPEPSSIARSPRHMSTF